MNTKTKRVAIASDRAIAISLSTVGTNPISCKVRME